jgi:AcrR family transcriptional regulator
MADIASRAGISKAALFVYFPSKAALFDAVITARVSLEITLLTRLDLTGLPFSQLLDAFLTRLAHVIDQPQLRKLARVVIAESGNFPDLARQWHDAVVGPALAAMIAAITAGQARAEVRDGDPRAMALGIIGPFLATAIWREVMEPVGGAPIAMETLLVEQRRTLAGGLLAV